MTAESYENIGWTVGNYCNARCGHCYSWKVRRTSSEFLTRSDVDRIVDQLTTLGVRSVNLGGNEPIYTHGSAISETILPYIINTLSAAGIPVGLTTNGISFSYLDNNYHSELLKINDIDFSLDSPYEMEHDLNRGGRLFRKVVSTIRRARELGIDCSIIACGMRANFTEEYLEAYLALSRVLDSEFRINTLKPVEPTLVDSMPTMAQFYAGFSYLMSRTDCITLGESCVTAFTGSGSQGCPCGTTSFRINSKTTDGRVTINPCVYMHDFKAGDLLTQDIFEILGGPEFTAFRNRRHHLPQACRDAECGFESICRGGCTARSYLTYGDLDSRDPYCPAEAVADGVSIDLPYRPPIGLDDGFRVHENYLCTWIGAAREDWDPPPDLQQIEAFLGPRDADDISHISGHWQSATSDQEEPSLMPSAVPVDAPALRRRAESP